jgi:hypothetical protein
MVQLFRFSLPDFSKLKGLEYKDAAYLDADEVTTYVSSVKNLLNKRGKEGFTAKDVQWFQNNWQKVASKIGNRREFKYIAEHITDAKKFASVVNRYSNVLIPAAITYSNNPSY